MNAAPCTDCRDNFTLHAMHQHGPHDVFDGPAIQGQIERRRACGLVPDAQKPCLKAAPGPAQAVTAYQPFRVGSPGLFAVQAGVPLAEAFDELSLLISTARDAMAELAQGMDGEGQFPHAEGSGLHWSTVYLLDMANALQSSMCTGLKTAQGDEV